MDGNGDLPTLSHWTIWQPTSNWNVATWKWLAFRFQERFSHALPENECLEGKNPNLETISFSDSNQKNMGHNELPQPKQCIVIFSRKSFKIAIDLYQVWFPPKMGPPIWWPQNYTSKFQAPLEWFLNNHPLQQPSWWSRALDVHITEVELCRYMMSSIYGCFRKSWYPTTMDFPTKNDHFGVF